MTEKPEQEKNILTALANHPRLAALALVIIIGLAYGNSFKGAFVFDDLTSIQDNPSIRHLWPPWKALSPPGQGATVQGRPLVNLSLAINYAWGGLNVTGYHLFNLGIHLANALLLFALARRTLKLPWCGEYINARADALAWAVALLWGVHPLTTAAVTYVVQRAESLMAMFYLLTLFCAVRSFTGETRRVFWQAASVAACWLGMACKEVMVSAPLMIWLFDSWLIGGAWRDNLRRRKWFYLGLAASWLWLIGLLLAAKGRGETTGYGGSERWWEYALSQVAAIATYIKLCYWPSPLVFDYGEMPIKNTWLILGSGLFDMALLAVWLLAVKRGLKWAVFLGLFFIALLAPSSSVIPVLTQIMGEHRMYLPLAIIIAATVVLLALGWHHLDTVGKIPAILPRWTPVAAAGLAAIILAGLTRHRNGLYGDPLALWTDVIEKRPVVERAYYNRSAILAERGDLPAALHDCNQAIALNPRDTDAFLNRGNIQFLLRHYDEAKQDFTQALSQNQRLARAYYGRGNCLEALGQPAAAMEDYDRALTLQPEDAALLYARGHLHFQMTQYAEAVTDLSKALRLRPGYETAAYVRGLAYEKLGETEDALEDYALTIKLKPDQLDAINNHGNMLRQLGRMEEAIQDYDRAIALAKKYAPAYFNRANAWRDLRQYEKALADYDRALALQPNYADIYLSRGGVLLKLARYQEAVENYDRLLALQPNHGTALLYRSLACQESGRLDEALESISRALAEHSDWAEAYYARGNVYRKMEHAEEALQDYSRAIQLKPDYTDAYYNRATIYLQRHAYAPAIADYTRVLALEPKQAKAYNNRAEASRRLGDYAGALKDYQHAAELQPENPAYLRSCAWLLATAPDNTARNGRQAVELAEKACRLASRSYGMLEVLAAAYAEAGRFADAAQTATEAMGKASQAGDTEKSTMLQKQLQLYQNGQPWREERPSP